MWSMDFSELTTLRVGGLAPPVVDVDSESELARVITEADSAGEDVLVLGSGSHLGYRSSIIKRSRFSADAGGGQLWGPTGRWVVLEASFQLRSASLSEPVRYRSLAESLGVDLGTRVPSWELREHVLKLRAESGMLLGPQDHDHPDHDTWSAGSFFGNPILSSQDAAKLPEEAPRFPVRNQAMFVSGTVHKQAPLVEGKQKVPAAWLTRQSGFEPGFRVRPDSHAALSSKHISAITNRGGATATEIMELAAAVHDRVAAKFGISLVPEPVLVGLEGLD